MNKLKPLIAYSQKTKDDEFKTPAYAVKPILSYLPKDKIYWECTDNGTSNISAVLRANKYKVISTYKQQFDFLIDEPNFKFDILITNPPYSLKTQFLERAYNLNKPFAFLMPITTLEGSKRNRLFKQYGIQILVLDKRVNFIIDKNNSWFNTSWFCWHLLPKDLIFSEIKRDDKNRI